MCIPESKKPNLNLMTRLAHCWSHAACAVQRFQNNAVVPLPLLDLICFMLQLISVLSSSAGINRKHAQYHGLSPFELNVDSNLTNIATARNKSQFCSSFQCSSQNTLITGFVTVSIWW